MSDATINAALGATTGLMGVAIMTDVAGKVMKMNKRPLRMVREPKHKSGHSIFHKSMKSEERFKSKGGKSIW